MRGFLNIDKPTGMTSFDVVRAIRRAAGVKRVGHAGTLDPLATGVLPVAIGGEATRLIDALVDASKRYVAEVTFGAETSTDDSEGDVVASADASGVDAEAVAHALVAFVGTHQQLPPAYSAIKVAGVPAYRAARRGEAHDLAAREVIAHAITLRSFEAGRAVIEVHCGKGYYVRSLARDLGRALGVYGHISALRRTMVGQFEVARAVPLAAAVGRLEARDTDTLLHAPDAVLTRWPAILLASSDVIEVRMGRLVSPEPRLESAVDMDVRARAYGPEGHLVALVEPAGDGGWHPYRVFPDETASQ